MPADRFVTPELARRMCEIARRTGRQVGVLVDRRGTVRHVVVGDAHRLFIPDLRRHRAGAGRLRGLRLLHVHLRGEGLTRDDLTDLALLRLDAVVAIRATPEGLPGTAEVGLVRPEHEPGPDGIPLTPWIVEQVPSVYEWDENFLEVVRDIEARLAGLARSRAVEGREGCIAIGVTTGDPEAGRRSLEELVRLAENAGLRVLDTVFQVRRRYDGRTVLGQGKLFDVLVRAMHLGAEVLVFDRELTPSQLRNIAQETDLKVIDRTQLILDIFAQRARSREGKLQVELAQLRYRRPRLAIMPTAMSRLTGGIGGRGPGETKLEINRRRADERQTRLARELQRLSRQRALRRGRRRRAGIPQVALVGYTNAGKSTLLNTMTRSAVDAEDELFATLDPTSRRLRFPEEREVVLVDTVGFIRELPRELFEAFRATLEEVTEADLVLHVADASSDELDMHLAAVERTLADLGVEDTPRLLVLNKIDLVDPAEWRALRERHGGVLVSAATGDGLDTLLVEMERLLFRERARRAAEAR